MINLLSVAFGVFLLVLTKATQISDINTKPRLIPPKIIKEMTFGYHDLVADLFWVRVIQDFDYCEAERSERAYNPGVTYQEALKNENISSRCNKGWVYQMISTVTDLAPRFKVPYKAGAIGLSVGVDDREGARIIFEKAIKQFPEDWTISYAASYHYLFEIQDPVRAADLLMQASRYGGPPWLPALASKLYSASGRQELGRSVIEEYLKTNPEGEGATRARKRLHELNSER